MSNDEPILIVGAGQAGAMAAAELRKLGHAGRIVIAGDEHHAPYERPPLSKSVLADAGHGARIGVHPLDFYSAQDIELRLGAAVTALDTTRKLAQFTSGEQIAYSACLLATGGSARVLPALPPGTPHVHYLRTLDDAAGLRAAMQSAGEILVIGGGFLGLETASTAIDMGLKVSVLESADRLLGRALPPELGDWLAQRARARGVDLRLGCAISALQPRADGVHIGLADGTTVKTSLVVVAIGMTPNVQLAAAAGLALHAGNGGIMVDEQGRTSVAGIYAAGDCCSQFQPLFDNHMRLESWQSANEQARLTAAAMLGAPCTPAATPWFWTDQFGCNIQMLGAPDPATRYTWRGTAASGDANPKFMLLGSRQGQLRHALAVNAGGDLRQLRALVGQDLDDRIPALCEDTRPLRQLVRDIQAESASPLHSESL
jgi:3-phenylpropionate/trans-cinnamate dioxygenase ferredoxin reductase subunit